MYNICIMYKHGKGVQISIVSTKLYQTNMASILDLQHIRTVNQKKPIIYHTILMLDQSLYIRNEAVNVI